MFIALVRCQSICVGEASSPLDLSRQQHNRNPSSNTVGANEIMEIAGAFTLFVRRMNAKLNSRQERNGFFSLNEAPSCCQQLECVFLFSMAAYAQRRSRSNRAAGTKAQKGYYSLAIRRKRQTRGEGRVCEKRLPGKKVYTHTAMLESGLTTCREKSSRSAKRQQRKESGS